MESGMGLGKSIKGHNLSGWNLYSSSSFLITISDYLSKLLPNFSKSFFIKLHPSKHLPCASSYQVASPSPVHNTENFSHPLFASNKFPHRTHATRHKLLTVFVDYPDIHRPSCLPTTTLTPSPCPSPTTRANNTQATAAPTRSRPQRRTSPSAQEPEPHTAIADTLAATRLPTPATPAATAATLTATTRPAESTSTTTCRTASPRPLTPSLWIATLRSRRKHPASSTQSTVSCWNSRRRRKPVSQRRASASTRATVTLRTCARTSSGRRRKSHR
ncbi:hypothetical protein CCHR01_11468 [Colletotrichum chrysophilum]|uniref:Uncharacterized protein n=1 Tax=Colletotrichum chrysophilum TaxID=1836956 RepID=A0AAD9AFA5_9PEZI|nr:hypothetical protein CCHR01_11468 [Colletotrichum chrysophilum]